MNRKEVVVYTLFCIPLRELFHGEKETKPSKVNVAFYLITRRNVAQKILFFWIRILIYIPKIKFLVHESLYSKLNESC